MPPRRSSRASSAKPQAEETPKPLARSRSHPPKRPVSSESDAEAEPATKRSRTTKKSEETPKANGKTLAKPRALSRTRSAGSAELSAAKKTRSTPTAKSKVAATPKAATPKATPAAKAAAAKAVNAAKKADAPKKAAPKKVVAVEPPMNAVPSVPEHPRPATVLFGCGAGNFGQLGMGADQLGEYSKLTRNKLVEEKTKEGEFGGEGAGIESIAAGGMHTLFIDEKGTVWSFGVNDEGALGRVTSQVPNPEKEGEFLDVDELTAVPQPVKTLEDENFRAVKIIAGDNISAAISDAGELRVWGSFRGNQGSLGFSSGSQRQYLPTAILDLSSGALRGAEPEKFVAAAAGNNHLLLLTTGGHIYALGAGEEGQLGRRVLERRKIHGTMPEKVVLGVRQRKAVVIGAGNNHSFAVDENGDTWAWGLNSQGQTGTGLDDPNTDSEVHSPKKVIGLSKAELNGARVVQIAGGNHHTLFLTSEGQVYACGRADDGQVGLAEDHPAFEGRENKGFMPTPTLITFPDMNDPIVQVSAGIDGNMAATEAGVLYTWGAQLQGELGLKDETGARTPEVVVRKDGPFAAVAVSCGGQHSVALLRKRETKE